MISLWSIYTLGKLTYGRLCHNDKRLYGFSDTSICLDYVRVFPRGVGTVQTSICHNNNSDTSIFLDLICSRKWGHVNVLHMSGQWGHGKGTREGGHEKGTREGGHGKVGHGRVGHSSGEGGHGKGDMGRLGMGRLGIVVGKGDMGRLGMGRLGIVVGKGTWEGGT